MKEKIMAIAIIGVFVAAAMAGTIVAAKPGHGNGHRGPPADKDNFGSYASTLATAHIPYAMEHLGLEFGEIFISPFTPATELEPEIEELIWNEKTQWWVVGPNEEYAAQWYTEVKEGLPIREVGHDYVVIWCKDDSLNDEYYWRYYNFLSSKPFPLLGGYYAYLFDVTGIGQ